MICVNELGELKCSKRGILEDLLILIAPYAPHLAEELWQNCGHNESITTAAFPLFNEAYLVENTFKYHNYSPSRQEHLDAEREILLQISSRKEKLGVS